MPLPKSIFLTIEIGGTKLQLIAFDAHGNIVDRWRFAIVKEHGAAGIRDQIQRCISEILKTFHVVRTGIGFGGPVNAQTGVIGQSHQIEGWSDFPIADWVSTQTGTLVVVENDANTAALGEATYGAGKGLRTVFYITIGSGVGGGLVQDGALYHGRSQGETEIGHLRLDPDGTTLEDLCAGWSVDKQVRDAVLLFPESTLASLVGDSSSGGEARQIGPALGAGCPVAREIMDRLTSRLAWGLSHVVHLFNPDILILGGGISLIGEPLSRGVASRLPGLVMKALQPVPVVRLAALGEDVVPMGALALVAGQDRIAI